jgi:hypothetical protein
MGSPLPSIYTEVCGFDPLMGRLARSHSDRSTRKGSWANPLAASAPSSRLRMGQPWRCLPELEVPFFRPLPPVACLSRMHAHRVSVTRSPIEPITRRQVLSQLIRFPGDGSETKGARSLGHDPTTFILIWLPHPERIAAPLVVVGTVALTPAHHSSYLLAYSPLVY